MVTTIQLNENVKNELAKLTDEINTKYCEFISRQNPYENINKEYISNINELIMYTKDWGVNNFAGLVHSVYSGGR